MQRLVPGLVQRATEIVGGVDKLAERLHVDPHRVHYWRQGTASAPNSVVVLLVDLILQDDIERAHCDRRKGVRAAGPHPKAQPSRAPGSA